MFLIFSGQPLGPHQYGSQNPSKKPSTASLAYPQQRFETATFFQRMLNARVLLVSPKQGRLFGFPSSTTSEVPALFAPPPPPAFVQHYPISRDAGLLQQPQRVACEQPVGFSFGRGGIYAVQKALALQVDWTKEVCLEWKSWVVNI